MSAITDFLKAELKMMRKARCANRLNGWYSTSHFVLKNGRAWKPAPLPSTVDKGEPGLCFMNAAKLAMDSSGLIYCEGYGLSLIPVPHAWCVDLEGNVVDPTWANLDFDQGREYFGIAINHKYLIAALLDNKRYGLIDAWQSHWPMLYDKPELWRHPIMESAEVPV